MVIPDSTSKPPLEIQSLRQASQSADNWTRKGQDQATRLDRIKNRVSDANPRSASKHGVPDQRSLTGPVSETTSGSHWLKRDRRTFDRQDDDQHAPPSPTPTARSMKPVSQQIIARSEDTAGIKTKDPNGADGAEGTLGMPLVSEPPPSVLAQNQASAQSSAELSKIASRITKKTGHRAKAARCRTNGEDAATRSGTLKPMPTSQSLTNPEVTMHTVAAPDSFLYNRIAHVPQPSRQRRIVSKVTKLGNPNNRTHTNSKAIPPSLQLNTNLEPSDQRERNSGATTSTGLPSAQIVPDVLFQNHILSLHSVDYLATNGMMTSRVGDTFDHCSTQAAVAIAQKALQDDLSSLEKCSPSVDLPTDTSTKDAPASQIKPFLSFNTPRKQVDITLKNQHSASQGPSSTQALINAITPYDFSATKSLKPSSGNRGDLTTKARSRAGSKAPAPESKTPLSNKSAANSSPAPPPEHLSLDSLGTALPFTLTASTTTTRQQDGQGFIPGIDDFDLNQAITDAGSFLKSWELQAETSFQTSRTAATHSSVRTGKP